MSWTVDAPVRIGPYVFAAIVETRISVRTFGSTLAAGAEKRPLLFLLLGGDQASGIDVNGRLYRADEIESLYPEAIARMKSLLPEAR